VREREADRELPGCSRSSQIFEKKSIMGRRDFLRVGEGAELGYSRNALVKMLSKHELDIVPSRLT
jgi:hypothetical protein